MIKSIYTDNNRCVRKYILGNLGEPTLLVLCPSVCLLSKRASVLHVVFSKRLCAHLVVTV